MIQIKRPNGVCYLNVAEVVYVGENRRKSYEDSGLVLDVRTVALRGGFSFEILDDPNAMESILNRAKRTDT